MESPPPDVHCRGESGLGSTILVETGTNGYLQDELAKEALGIPWVLGLVLVDQDLGGAIKLVGGAPTHTRLRTKRRCSASRPVHVRQPSPL